jgi:thermitase
MLYDYDNNRYAQGKVIAALDEAFASSAAPEYDLAPVLEGIDYEKIEVLFHSNNAEEESGAGDIILIYLKNKNKAAVLGAIEILSKNPYVLYAEPDYLETMHVVPSDPLFQKLWGTKKVGAPLAWNYSTGSPRVSVGVIDTGIDYRHPDVRSNMWASPDGRLQNGWNFADNSRNSMDIDGHGTHVAGTIGAVGNNGIGMTGICWDVRVVSMKFGLDVASAVAAIDFANRFDIPILNSSWGGRAYSKALKQAIEAYDGLFIASAGNNGTNNDIDPIYPASYDCDNILSVAATNPDDTLARFSNYGVNSVDIAAPGTNILSLGLRGTYTPKNGTSMSAPHVAGAAALLKAYMPHLSALTLKHMILSSAVKSPYLDGKLVTGGMLNVNAMFVLADYLKKKHQEKNCEMDG